jgi:hypothetical protein
LRFDLGGGKVKVLDMDDNVKRNKVEAGWLGKLLEVV